MSAKKPPSPSGAELRAMREQKLAAQTSPEQIRRLALDKHERAIENFRRGFIDAGEALKAIRDGRLYADSHDSFVEYCADRWEMTDAHANRLIAAFRVAAAATPIGVEINSEAVARELISLVDTPENIKQVYDEAKRRAAGGRVTAKLVGEVRRALFELEGEVVDPLGQVPAAAEAVRRYEQNSGDGGGPADGAVPGHDSGDGEPAHGDAVSGQNAPAAEQPSSGETEQSRAHGRHQPEPNVPTGPDVSSSPEDGRSGLDHPGANPGDEVPAQALPPPAGTDATPSGSGQPGEAPETGSTMPVSGDPTQPDPRMALVAALTDVNDAIDRLVDHDANQVGAVLGDETDDLINELADALEDLNRWLDRIATTTSL